MWHIGKLSDERRVCYSGMYYICTGVVPSFIIKPIQIFESLQEQENDLFLVLV